jgi:hypothetical protein
VTQAIQRQSAELATQGSFSDARRATQALEEAGKRYNLVSPATSVGALPEGCAVALTLVAVDVDNDTYNVTGKRGLGKSKLQQIAAALGVSWDPIASGRLDDGSDPYYVRWRAVGTYRAFDGQVQTLVAEKELDLRPGSPTCVGLEQQQAAKQKSADGQIREMRMHIQQHAETKAQLRAIRSLGLKTSYTTAELAKPFVCARIMFTGQSADPELRREFARLTAESFLSGQKGLYGRSPVGGLSEPVPAPARLAAPPPVGRGTDDSGEYAFDTSTPSEPAQQQTQQQPKTEAKPAQPTQSGGHASSGFKIPGGKAKGTPLEDAEDRDLEYWAERIGKELNAGTSRDEERDGALHAALVAELQGRKDGRY